MVPTMENLVKVYIGLEMMRVTMNGDILMEASPHILITKPMEVTMVKIPQVSIGMVIVKETTILEQHMVVSTITLITMLMAHTLVVTTLLA